MSESNEPVEPVEPGDMDPEAAAQLAQGSGPELEASDPGLSHSNGIIRALRNSDPHQPIDQVDPPSELRQKWKKYLWRGGQKVTDVRGGEAWVDLVMGTIGAAIATMNPDVDEDGDLRQGEEL